MCGRYYIKEDCWDKAAEDFSILKDRTDGTLPCGDISPGMPAVSVTAGRQTEAEVQTLLWGFAGFDRGKLIINARSEGVRQKPLFADSFREFRFNECGNRILLVQFCRCLLEGCKIRILADHNTVVLDRL